MALPSRRLLIRELVDLGGTITSVDWSELPDLDAYEPNRAYLTWHIVPPARRARSTSALHLPS